MGTEVLSVELKWPHCDPHPLPPSVVRAQEHGGMPPLTFMSSCCRAYLFTKGTTINFYILFTGITWTLVW